MALPNRVDGTTERKLYAKVIDNFHETPVFAARVLGRAKKFTHKTADFTLKITNTGQGEWFHGMPNLNSSATDTTVTVSYEHKRYSHPIVIPIDEAMANAGEGQTIPLIAFKTEEASEELVSDLATALYSTGTGDLPNGLGMYVDDGTSVATVGGVSRTTYPALKAVKTASGGTLSIQKMATLYTAITNGSRGGKETPTIALTTPTIFDLYEQLLQPSVRANIDASGYSMLPIRGDRIVKAGQLLGAGGFQVLSYRGIPFLADSYCPDGYLYLLNENYMEWQGRTVIPSEFKDNLMKVDLGTPKTIEGQEMMPSSSTGIFRTKMDFHPDQPGAIARLYIFGNYVAYNFRRSGVLTGVTQV